MKHANAPRKDAAPSSISRRTLRQRAEEIAVLPPEDIEALSPDEIRQALHDLRVHQIELEMQNEELRRTQVELDAARVRYFDLYDLAPVGYCTLTEKGLILEANLTAATLLGAARNALVRQPITRFILKEDQDIYYLHRKQLVETAEPQACELRMVREDGTQLWARLEATAAQAADGVPVQRVVMSEITERKRAEETLRLAQLELEASHRNYLELYDFAPVGYFTLDEAGMMIEANITCATLLGMERAHLIKQCFRQFVLADDQDTYHSFKNRLFEAVSTQSCELRLSIQADPPIYVKLDGATRVDSNGDITQARIAVSDVSIQKQAEQQYLAWAVEREKTEIVRTFLENAAHNIRTPLTILNTTLYLLEQERVLEHQKTRFGVINIQVKRLIHLVENMFTLMHMNELADFQFDYLDLNALVTNVVDEQSLLAEQQGLTCTFYPDASLSQVWADSVYLASAISNLVMNALNYTPSGGKVLVRTDRRNTNTNAEISVEDNGIGISDADLPHIFERFFRSNLAINTSQHGTGLGLSIAEKIVKAHGGHIEVESEPGQGSTFRICLPIALNEASVSWPK